MKLVQKSIAILVFTAVAFCAKGQDNSIKVIGYFSGKADQVENIPAKKLSHIIYSFCHLQGNRLAVDSKDDSVTITKLVALKKINPHLKIALSLGGWGGCASCAEVFSTQKGRKEFANSVLQLSDQFHTDGIDLDWEYPAIEGYPGHAFYPSDRQNFTALVAGLRKMLGPRREISLAAGGFKKFLEESIDWAAVLPWIDRVNIMTYDLVNGYSKVTGHHTPLYSSDRQPESTDFAVQYLINHGVPRNKLVIGAAFYARVWGGVSPANHGLYQAGTFKMGVDYKNFEQEFSSANGFQSFWDSATQAPYGYSAIKKLFATYDDKRSVQFKTKYAIDQGLQGIMFWELTLDNYANGLLSEIDNTVKSHKAK